jgi:hypothetical protein
MRRALAALAVLLAALAVSASALASPGARFGIQDDAWLLTGPGTVDQRITTLQGLGVGVVRLTVRWDEVEPTRGTLDWGTFGTVLDALHARGVTALVTLAGAPRWANGSSSPWHLPATGFGAFAAAAAARFPWVHMWTAWNEPNNGVFASPVSPSLYVREVLNPAYAALHAASSQNLVAGGVTSPRRTPAGMAPLAFMQGIRAAHGRLDAYAVNPYPLSPADTPTHSTCSHCGYFTMAELPQIRADVTRYFGAKPLWLTEYGYQTNPPDELLGVSQTKQALYIGEAALRVWRQPGVTVLIQYLLRDEPNIGGWQSGLYTSTGAPKLAAHAFPLPLAEQSRSGSRVTLWGQVRPGSGARSYELQVRTSSGAWHTVAAGKTTRSGAFARAITARVGARIRLYAPSLGYAGPALTVA